MTGNTQYTPDAAAEDEFTLEDPASLREHDDVDVRAVTESHETRDNCGTDGKGEVVVEIRDDNGELLLMRNDEYGIAVLPHGKPNAGEDWAAAAREEVEALTGVSIALDGVEALREVEHVVEGDDEAHATTYRVIFAGRPGGGEIQDCKQGPEAGSNSWWTCWSDGLPTEASVPPGGPGEDLTYVLD